ncbi:MULTISPECIES: hypothetical protein [Pantoea]|uniref:Uncharacterized protein n=1 Tax=Candidatus Pantoea gossypiicola TaxID=2608008 RepID=A0AB34CEL8_9GAMM|nr:MULTISPECIES: hypothetical protein [Pantoea]KAA5923573.1 hypothetical protein F3I59_20275 [Pantoea sp. VH_8]KAA5929544.1 hypothetical protein F3I58_20495 [Pantoea sp. VH_4]KAA5981390.1 hypothetical protein F3I49_19695 [Pantoea sp. M_4]KAA6120128.1 hypothetical protein F3I20_20325 [Pantoea gossypiicola]
MTTPEQKPASLERFEKARAEHTERMKAYNGICADIARCEKEQQAAIEAGKEAESNWRTSFRNLRGNLTDELRAEHSQRIASRELADEFGGLLKELALDKQEAMLKCCGSGKEYVESHREAFTGFSDAHWQSALRNVSPSLLWAIKLRIRREELSPTFAGDDRDRIKDVAYLVGEALTQAAAALPESVLKEAPLLENIGLHRPALTGVDMELYTRPLRRQKLGESIRAQRVKLQEGSQK